MSKETIEKIANKIWEYGVFYQSESEQLAKYIYQDFIEPLEKENKVLSREEYDNLKLEIQKAHNKGVRAGFDLTKYKENSIEQARKETAENILKDLIKNCQFVFDITGKPIIALDGDFAINISKQYGVEVDND